MTAPFSLCLTSSDSPTSDQSTPGSPSSVQPSLATADSSKPTLDAFTTALCMLNYNIAYLSHTQGLEVPLSVAGETLRNLWAACCISSDALAREDSRHTSSFSYYAVVSIAVATTHGVEDIWVGVRSAAAGDESSDDFVHRIEAQQKELQYVSNKVKTGLAAGANDD
ncbi:hypothetical protein FRB90_010660 [Tulasnella sp. 427]|nr:hypothetical protein FRB90_010660 [Tulasnella sp. 427]